jgi:hypothetical protein
VKREARASFRASVFAIALAELTAPAKSIDNDLSIDLNASAGLNEPLNLGLKAFSSSPSGAPNAQILT